MNKYLKGCLIFLGVIAISVLILIALFYWSIENSKKQAKEDLLTGTEKCDSAKTFTDKPMLSLSNFEESEIDRLKFYIIRNNKVISDTTIQVNIDRTIDYTYTTIPFDEFLKSDTIIVETKGKPKLYYCISGFHHKVYLHYGMFGYVGSYDCRFDDSNYKINGKYSNGRILKQEGIKDNILPK